jgi:hypothetical protein
MGVQTIPDALLRLESYGLVKRAAGYSSMRDYAVYWAALPSNEKWTEAEKYLANPEFHKAVVRNRKIDKPTRRTVDLLFKQRTSKKKASVKAFSKSEGGKDGRGRYAIHFDPRRRRWMCSCKDWKFRRAFVRDMAPASRKNCKHIKRHLSKKRKR